MTPNYEWKKTVQELQQEYDNWASSVSKAQFAKDKGISVNSSEFNRLYEQELSINRKSFYTVATSKGETFYYYYGNNNDLRQQLKSQKNILAVKKQTVRFNSSMADINNTFNQVGSEVKKGIDQTTVEVKKTVGVVEQEWNSVKQSMEGTYAYSEAARSELLEKAKEMENGTITAAKAKEWVQEFNKRYETNVSTNVTAESLRKAADKKNGILHVTGNDIAFAAKKEIKNLSNLSQYWDNSSNETIKKFTDQGITGDIMWDTIRGKYNKDDAARRDLEKLQKLVNEGKGNSDEAIALRNKINEKYEMNLDDSVTAEDIAKIVASDQKYTYKKKIKQIAEDIIQDKLNEQITKQIEKKIGGKLEDWGVSFPNGDIVGTIRDIIRGNKVAFFQQEKFFKKLQKELETKIDKMIVQKVNSIVDNAANKITSAIDSAYGQVMSAIDPFRQTVDNVYNKLDTWLSNPLSAKLNIADRLDQLIKSPVDKISGFLDRIEPFKKFGINLGLSDMFKTVTQSFTKGIADKMYTMTRPFVEKALGLVKTVKTQITKLIKTIDKIKEKVKQLVEKWKNYIKNVVQEFTQKVVNEIMKYVKVGIGNLLGGFASDIAGNLVGGITSGITGSIGGLF